MAREMYSYTLTVLEKVSFDTDLFISELKKASERLLPYELSELKLWLNSFVFKNPHLYPARTVLII
ncbi:hypothetical protein [Wenyingzhuangia sp. 2_MG-2023]|uniref:hypothetical protein n=1 Tax=Wenyingzhuangia sp. 2_MG-2023 TaxID=3062639 RepID=UPI0026E41435|nr:hypothetical protein [Wenyingzhuangia sp. 2_MG-2023]MDO6738601.1 hypothetical protein [Wenyingzhuangia sp. 2_MG-2023]MDO6802867.1 hypothetical protein [Wenyingzhuangia sp. 1_MG-2023]